jgi:hypothetical protein
VTSPLLAEIDDTIAGAYEAHMRTPQGRREPLYPPTVLARAAGTRTAGGDADRDPLTYGPVLRAGLQDHLAGFGEEYGVDVRPVLAATFVVNLLTEDNLPHYTHKNMEVAGDSEALATWVDEWTAEEDAHGVLMRDYALLSGLIADGGAIDHATYFAGRTSQLRHGTEVDPPSTFHAFAYLTLQEYLTKEAHNSLSWLLDRCGRTVLRPVAGDEHNHYEFYLALSAASLAVDPDATLVGMRDVYSGFEMPGRAGIPGFADLAAVIGVSGMFDAATVADSMRLIADKLQVGSARPTTEAGRQAQSELVTLTGDRQVGRRHTLMERVRARVPVTPGEDGLRPFVLGVTIDYDRVETPAGPRIVGLRPLDAGDRALVAPAG